MISGLRSLLNGIPHPELLLGDCPPGLCDHKRAMQRHDLPKEDKVALWQDADEIESWTLRWVWPR